MQVMRLLVAGQIEHKTAGLLPYALQTASVNLKHTEFEPTIKEHVVMDPREIPNASLGQKLWDPDHYETKKNAKKTKPAQKLARKKQKKRQKKMTTWKNPPHPTPARNLLRTTRTTTTPSASRCARTQPSRSP